VFGPRMVFKPPLSRANRSPRSSSTRLKLQEVAKGVTRVAVRAIYGRDHIRSSPPD